MSLRPLPRWSTLLALLLWPRPGLEAQAAPPNALPKAKLLVVISVDQMRADYLERFAGEFKGGFARLREKGTLFTQAHHDYVSVETAPGHAILMTGRFPARHGILAAEWYDRSLGRGVYAVEDELFAFSPLKMRSPTVGDALKAKNPLSKAVALSGKERGAILMGGRRPDTAVWFDIPTGRYATSPYYGTLPSWVDAFNRDEVKGLFPPPPPQKAAHAVSTVYAVESLEDPRFDVLLGRLAERALDALDLGQDEHPDLLTLSFSATDIIGHHWGPYSPQMREQLLSLDKVLGDFFAALDKRVGSGYAAILTSDHGVFPVPESPEGKALGARRLHDPDFLNRAEKALREALPPIAEAERWLLYFYPPNLYLDRSLAGRLNLGSSEFLEKAARALRAFPEIAEVFTRDQLEGYREMRSPRAELFRRSYDPERSGDLLLYFKEGVLYTWEGYQTDHSQPYPYDTHVPLIFYGAGAREGRHDGFVSLCDLAPTAAEFLAVTFPPEQGCRALAEALR